MNNIDFARKCYDIAKNYKTLYVTGGLGQALTADKKVEFVENYTNNLKRKDAIYSASEDTRAFDCSGLVKGILWGFPELHYKQAPLTDDIYVDEMIKRCTDVSKDFEKLTIGELLWLPGHCGVVVSVSPALAVEAAPKWSANVQITAINSNVNGYQRRDWVKHGKMPWVSYEITQTCRPVVVYVKQGSKGPAVESLQRLLISAGYSCGPKGADGSCGPATVEAIKRYQQNNNDIYGKPLEVDGKAGALTWGSLINRGDII